MVRGGQRRHVPRHDQHRHRRRCNQRASTSDGFFLRIPRLAGRRVSRDHLRHRHRGLREQAFGCLAVRNCASCDHRARCQHRNARAVDPRRGRIAAARHGHRRADWSAVRYRRWYRERSRRAHQRWRPRFALQQRHRRGGDDQDFGNSVDGDHRAAHRTTDSAPRDDQAPAHVRSLQRSGRNAGGTRGSRHRWPRGTRAGGGRVGHGRSAQHPDHARRQSDRPGPSRHRSQIGADDDLGKRRCAGRQCRTSRCETSRDAGAREFPSRSLRRLSRLRQRLCFRQRTRQRARQ